MTKADALQELAELAGLQVEWENFRGEKQRVDAEVVRTILAALQFDVDDVDGALAEYRAELEQQAPALLVGRVGEALQLPPLLAAAEGEIRLEADEAEGEVDGATVRAGNGRLELGGELTPGYYRLRLGDHLLRLAVAPRRCLTVAELARQPRAWGLAAQLYSLRRRGDGGIGDFTALTALAESAAAAGADALAISPVHAPFAADVHHFSPYSPSSRLFLNPLHVDLDAVLAEAGLVASGAGADTLPELQRLEQAELIDWPAAATLRLRLLRLAWERMGDRLLRGEGEAGREFQRFRAQRGVALENHARFEAIHARQFAADSGRWHWRSWEPAWRDPDSDTVARFAKDHAAEIGYHAWLQWLAERGLAGAQRAARAAGMGIGLVADLAVGTDTGGSHAWSYQHDMLIGLAVGAPPDLLNTKGQNWGLTTFSPRGLRHHGFQPFIDMLRACLRHAGGLRIDHILGLRRLWVIPDGLDDGAYLTYPLEEMLKLIALESWRHRAVICGEDLGTVPEGLRDDLAATGVLGMRVLWFERDHGLFIDRRRWSERAMAVTTTHDLPTVAGWWSGRDIDWRVKLKHLAPDRDEAAERAERDRDRQALWSAFDYAGVLQGETQGAAPPAEQPEAVVTAALRFVGATPAPLVVVPLEDALALPEQPNLPGTTDEHPNWRRRLPGDDAGTLLAQPEVAARLAALQEARNHS